MRVKTSKATPAAKATRGSDKVSWAGIVENCDSLPSFFSTITPRLEESKYWHESPPHVSSHWPRGRMRRLATIDWTTGRVRRILGWNFIGFGCLVVWFG